MTGRIEEKLDNVTEALKEVKADLKEVKADLEPVFAHVNMVKGAMKAVGLGISLGGLLVGVLKLFF